MSSLEDPLLLLYSPSFQLCECSGPTLVVLPAGVSPELPQVEVIEEGELSSCQKTYQTIVLYKTLDGKTEEKVALILKKVRSLLSADGTLYVGADNRFGLSYLSGVAPTSGLFKGVEDGSLFSHNRLEKTLLEAGFGPLSFYYPFPSLDKGYTVFSDAYLPYPGQLNEVSVKLAQDRYVLFDEEKAYNAKAGMDDFPYVANSFFVKAGGKTKTLFSSVDMSRQLSCRIITQIKEEGGRRYVMKKPYSFEAEEHILAAYRSYPYLKDALGEDGVVAPELIGKVLRFPYIEGQTLSEAILEAFAKRDVPRIKDLFKAYKLRFTGFAKGEKLLYSFAKIKRPGFSLSRVDLDANFDNFILGEENHLTLIDYEWPCADAIPQAWLFYRSITHFYHKYAKADLSAFPKEKAYAFFDLDAADFAAFDELNQSVLDAAIGKEAKPFFREDYVFDAVSSYEQGRQDLLKEMDLAKLRINDLLQENGELKDHVMRAESEVGRSHEEIEQTKQRDQQEIDRLNEEIQQRNLHLSHLDKEIVSLRQNIQARDATIEEKDSVILDKEATIKSKEEALAQKESELADTQNQVQQKTDELNKKCAEVEAKIQELAKTNGALDEARNELTRIHNSRGYRALKKWYRFRDWLLPKGTKRRLFVKTFAYCVRHPIIAFRALRHGKAKDYFATAKSDPAALERKMQNYGERMEESEAPVGLIFFKEKDYKPFAFPECKKPLVSIIIPVYNQFFYTYNCLKAVLAHTDPKVTPYEVILADDVSSDETVNIKKLVKNLIVVRNKKNTGFLLNCNNGAKVAKGKYVYFLNNDTNVQPGYLAELVEYIEAHPDCGAVGSKLVYGNGWLQEAGGIFWKDGSAWNFGNKGDRDDPQFNYVKDVDYISGASLLVRHDSWKKLGGFSTEFVPAYCEDSDLCFSIRYKLHQHVVYIPTSVVVHFEGISNGTDLGSGLKQYQVTNSQKLFKKWEKELSTHNPNGEGVFHARDMSYDKKTILVIDHYVPQYDKDAGSRTIFTYLQLLVGMGFNVKFIGDNFYRHEPYTTVLQKMGIEVLYGNKAFHNWKSIIKDWAPYLDFVFLSRPHISIKYVDFIRENTHAKILYYGHDLHMMRLRREMELTGNAALQKEIDRFQEMEETLFKKADKSFFPSPYEVKYLEKAYPDSKFGVLQGFMYPKSEFKAHENTKDILFVGGFGHGPNIDAVLYFVKEVWPSVKAALPEVKFHVVGSSAPEEITSLNSSDIIIHGFVENDELARLYETTSIVVAPLRYGAGIKGKITEAMANCEPLVTTTCGAEGLDGTEDFLLVEDDPSKMAKIIIDLYQDKPRQIELAKKQKAYVNAHFSFDSAREIFEEELR